MDITIKRKHFGFVQTPRRKRAQSGIFFLPSRSSIKQHLKASNSVENDLIWPPARELHNGYLHRGAIGWWLKSAKKRLLIPLILIAESQIEADFPLLLPRSLSPYGPLQKGHIPPLDSFCFFAFWVFSASLSYLNIKWIREICFSLYLVDISRELMSVFVAKMKWLCLSEKFTPSENIKRFICYK